MIVVYDNNLSKKSLTSDWGFSCFIKGLEKSILFDTGGDGKILLSNMEKLEIGPDEINLVILSHDHRDHTGGLMALLRENPRIEVWLPEFFSSKFKRAIEKEGGSIIEVDKFKKICEGAYTTGVIQGWIKEQSLILETKKGLIVMTGCAHPRIMRIVSFVKELFKKDIHMALGGFHLAGFTKQEIDEIINHFRAMKIEKVGPCHCSGDNARRLFSLEYKENFLEIATGTEILIQ